MSFREQCSVPYNPDGYGPYGSVARATVNTLSPDELKKIFDVNSDAQKEYARLRNGSEENLAGLTRLEYLRHKCLKDKVPRHFLTFALTDFEYAKLNYSERVLWNEYFEEMINFRNRPSLFDFIVSQKKNVQSKLTE